jgi:hypothetical protein
MGETHRFDVVAHTEHALTCDAPPTMPGRNAAGRHDYVTASQPVLALAEPDLPLPDFAWEHDQGRDWPALRRTQFATWTAHREIASAIGLRPGAHVIEAIRDAPGEERQRPIAAEPSGGPIDLDELVWYDAHDGTRLVVSTDPLDIDAVIVDTLRARIVASVRTPENTTPELIEFDPRLVRRVGRRGIAMIERSDTPVVTENDVPSVLIDLARTIGPTRFAALTGVSARSAVHLAEGHRPRAATVRRILNAFDGTGHGDPHDIARLVDAAHAAASLCGVDGCAETARPGVRYCSAEHARTARRLRDRDRKRRIRSKAAS